MLRRLIRTVVRVGLWVGTAFTAIRALLGWYGELQTAKDVFDSRGPIIELLGRLVLAQWFWPALAISSFAAYLSMEAWPRLRRYAVEADEAETSVALRPPTTASTEEAIQSESNSKRKLGVAELFVLEPKAVETFNAAVPAAMARLGHIAQHTKAATERLRAATKGFRPEVARSRNLQVYLDYAKAINGELPELEGQIARVELSAGELGAVYVGLGEYAGRKKVSLGPYVPRAKETIRLTGVNVPKLDDLIESIRSHTLGQAAPLDEAADRYIALLDRLKASQLALADACRSMLKAVGDADNS